MFGYIDRQKARSVGFTHQGTYFGIPLWLTSSTIPMVSAKWMPLELVVTLLRHIERIVKLAIQVDTEQMHQVKRVRAI